MPGPGRAEEMDDLGAGDEVELGQRQDAVAIERGLEGEVEALQRLRRRQPRGLERDADASGLADGVFLGEQAVDRLERGDLAMLHPPDGVVQGFQRARHAQPDEVRADAVERSGHDAALSPASRRPNGVVEGERATSDAWPGCLWHPHRWRLAMRGIDAALVLAFENRVRGDQRAVLEDPDFLGMVLNLDDALSRGVGDAVEIAADRDHALMADPPLDGEHGAVGNGGMGDQRRFLFGEVRVHNPVGGGVDAWIGDLDAPLVELVVEIVHVPEGPGQEEVLPDVSVGPLDLALGLGPVGPAGARKGAVVVQQRDERAVVGSPRPRHPLR